MVSSSVRWVVLVAVLLGIIGCQPATTVSRKEFRTIVFNQAGTSEVTFDHADDSYDYYSVDGKMYRVAHREPLE